MGYRVKWTWAIADVDADTGELLALDYADSLSEFYADDLQDAIRAEIVDAENTRLLLHVIRRQVDKNFDEVSREIVHIRNGIIEPMTLGGHRVPNRLQSELNKINKDVPK